MPLSFVVLLPSPLHFTTMYPQWFLLPLYFSRTSSQACNILFLKVFHRLGRLPPTNSLTLSLREEYRYDKHDLRVLLRQKYMT